MQNNKFISVLLIGIIIGWFLPDCHSRGGGNPITNGNPITIHDTLKTTSVQYKIIPGTDYNIDSLITVINQYWKDSLKNMYGKGHFESTFSKVDNLGTRFYTLASRIPLDPESQLIVDESFVFPKKTIGLIGSIGSSASLSIKYYIINSKCFSLSGFVLESYMFNDKCWTPNMGIECEYRF